jgi:hypothetical protein
MSVRVPGTLRYTFNYHIPIFVEILSGYCYVQVLLDITTFTDFQSIFTHNLTLSVPN